MEHNDPQGEPLIPRMLPFEPATYKTDQQRLLRGMSQLSGQPIDSSATCEFPDDPSFWPKFTEQANNCPYAKRGRQYTIPYLDERPVEASFKWVKAYRDCLSENNPIEVVVSSKTVARSFRIPVGFYELFMPKTGLYDASVMVKLEITDDRDGNNDVREIGIRTWNELVTEWNDQIHLQKDPNDRVARDQSRDGASESGRVEQVCVCQHHSPQRAKLSLGMSMAAVFQQQRHLHFSLVNGNAYSAECAITKLTELNAFDRVIDLLQCAFPNVDRDMLGSSYAFYMDQVLENPMSRATPGGKHPLPRTWPPPGRAVF
eukprot:Rhum_TRINITY_DN25511_c0_g1::Rhum_TRINITY_DN25511_c0_g1_i1::g.182286::m.182286